LFPIYLFCTYVYLWVGPKEYKEFLLYVSADVHARVFTSAKFGILKCSGQQSYVLVLPLFPIFLGVRAAPYPHAIATSNLYSSYSPYISSKVGPT
jgi:hypothetical protein